MLGSGLHWDFPSNGRKRKCFSMTIPDMMISQGISEIKFESDPFLQLYVHRKKMFRAFISSSSTSAYYSSFSNLQITHQILDVLNYDGDDCIDDDNYYDFHQCFENYIHKVKPNKN